MFAAYIFVLRMSPSCLLPLQEALQDQQMGPTQGPFKLLPLCWISECVGFCMCTFRMKSLPTALWVSVLRPTVLQSQMFWGLIFLIQEPQVTKSNVELVSLSPWGKHLQL